RAQPQGDCPHPGGVRPGRGRGGVTGSPQPQANGTLADHVRALPGKSFFLSAGPSPRTGFDSVRLPDAFPFLAGYCSGFGGFVSPSRPQSPSPSPLLPGGVKVRSPEFASGAPPTAVYVPRLGSYQRAVAAALSRAMSTFTVRSDGRYAITRVPSGVRAAV